MSESHILLTDISVIRTHRGEQIPADALEFRVAYLEDLAQRAIEHLATGEGFRADVDLTYGVLNGIPIGIRCIDILVST